MKRKYVARCSVAFLLILLQADVIDSRGSRGRSRSSSSKSHSSSSGSQFGSSSSDSISSSSDSSNSDSSFRNGLGRRRWESSKSEGSSTSYLQPMQEPFPTKHRPQNPEYSSLYPWDSYNAKPWRPKPPKAKLKHVAGARIAGSAVGADGDFLLGGSMTYMEFPFWDPKEEQWWYEHRDSYSDMVYFRNYDQYPVPEDVFVGDCVNVTVGEFIKNQTDKMEIKVVTHVVRQMCKEEYRESFFRRLRESNSGKIRKMTNTAGAVIASVEGPNGGHDRVVALHISFLMMLLFLTKLLCY
ncbi:major prion protein-like [Anolis sagrei]|uniref:major prion protein-like n=1 Tax=Anolis sagrei TaxID=38937 RepID=UPI003520175F